MGVGDDAHFEVPFVDFDQREEFVYLGELKDYYKKLLLIFDIDMCLLISSYFSLVTLSLMEFLKSVIMMGFD